MAELWCQGTDTSEAHSYEWPTAETRRHRCPAHAHEQRLILRRADYQANPEKARASSRAYMQTPKGRELNKEKARRTSARRWARKRGAKIVDRNVSWRTVAERDGILCWLCDYPTDPCDYEMVNDGRTFIAGQMYPTLDHVIPLVHGGEHSMANGKLAHKVCNRNKADRILTEDSHHG